MRLLFLLFLGLTCLAQDKKFTIERFIPQTSFKVKAEIGVWYKTSSCANSNHSNKITKPFIICEGFDVDGTNDLSAIRSSMGSFFVNENGIMVRKFILDQFRNDGWDVIIVNLLNNGEAIENNALLVEQLLKDVDTEVLNNHTTYGTYYHRPMLMGISMGGLICRYALAKMEREGSDHKVEKYISFDTPHKGANVPLALQAFIDKFTGDFNFINQFRSARPSVLRHLDPISYIDQYITPNWKKRVTQTAGYQMSAMLYGMKGNQNRSLFLSKLAALGNYPSKCRMVAIANGANGTAQDNMWAGKKNFDWSGAGCAVNETFGSPIGDIHLRWCPFKIEERWFAMPGNGVGVIENTLFGTQLAINQFETASQWPKPALYSMVGSIDAANIDHAPGGSNYLSTFGVDSFATKINDTYWDFGVNWKVQVPEKCILAQISFPCGYRNRRGKCLWPDFSRPQRTGCLKYTPAVNFTVVDKSVRLWPFGKVNFEDNYCFVPTVGALDINTNSWFENVSQKGQYPHDKSFTPFDAIYWHNRNSQHAYMDFGENGADFSQPKFMMEEISPDNLFIQNRPFPDGYKNTFEARGYIAVGKNVDQVPSRSLIGDVVLASNSDVTFSVGTGYGNFVYFDDGFDSGNSTVDVVYNTYSTCTKNFNTVSTTLPRDQVWQQLRKESDEPQAVLSRQPEVTSNNEPQKFDLQAWINEGEKDSPLATFQVEAVPNPFNSETILSFYLSETSVVSLDIYDAHGVPVSKVLNETILASGNNSATVSLVNQLPGLYIYKIVVNGKPYTGKLIKQ